MRSRGSRWQTVAGVHGLVKAALTVVVPGPAALKAKRRPSKLCEYAHDTGVPGTGVDASTEWSETTMGPHGYDVTDDEAGMASDTPST